VSDVTFVTFFGDRKCDVSLLPHFSKESDALALYFFLTGDVFYHFFPEQRHFLAPLVQIFLNGKKYDDSAGTETCFPFPVSDLSLISEA